MRNLIGRACAETTLGAAHVRVTESHRTVRPAATTTFRKWADAARHPDRSIEPGSTSPVAAHQT